AGDRGHRGRGGDGIFAGLEAAGDAFQMGVGLEQQAVFHQARAFQHLGDVMGARMGRDQDHGLIAGARHRPRRIPRTEGPFHDPGDDGAQRHQDQEKPHQTLERISAALVPPKPKLLDMAIFTSRFWALSGTRSSAVSTLGFSRLIVGGTIPSRIARRQKIASTEPAAPSRWPIEDLVEDMAVLDAALPKNRSTAPNSMPSAMVEVPCAFT